MCIHLSQATDGSYVADPIMSHNLLEIIQSKKVLLGFKMCLTILHTEYLTLNLIN